MIKHIYKQDKSKTPNKSNRNGSITPNKRSKAANNDLYVKAMVKNKLKEE